MANELGDGWLESAIDAHMVMQGVGWDGLQISPEQADGNPVLYYHRTAAIANLGSLSATELRPQETEDEGLKPED